MIKYSNTRKNFGYWFNSIKSWTKSREFLLIKDKAHLETYRLEGLNQIKKYYNLEFKDISSKMPNVLNSYQSTQLRTSGSQSSYYRTYFYSLPQYKVIENHHWWRIEQSHNLTDPGLIFDFAYTPTYMTNEKYKECFIEDWALENHDPTGMHNKFKTICYRRNTSANAIIETLKEVRDQGPKIIICSPSQLEWLYFQTKDEIKFECPIISTRETLAPHVRKIGEKMFQKVIDKMRCWDGGITFYECPYKTLHICDELCNVEQLDNGQLVSTDYFNYSTPFINYLNGDAGKINQKKCECGIFGNFFEKFEGKTSSIIYAGNYSIPGCLIIEDVNSLIKFGGCSSNTFGLSMIKKYEGNPFEKTDIIYCIRQKKDYSIEFICQSNPPLKQKQKQALIDGLNFILFRQTNEGLSINEIEKQYIVPKQEIKIIENRNLLDENVGLRNKRQSVFSEVHEDKIAI